MAITMYLAKVNSPAATLAVALGIADVEATLTDIANLPAAPNLCTLGTGEDAETVLYTVKGATSISGLTRGFQGTAKAWAVATVVYRGFTAYDADTFKANIETLQGDTPTFVAEGDVVYASGAGAGTILTIGATDTILSVQGGVPTWRTPANILVDLSGQAGAAFDWGSQNLTSLGTLNTHTIPAGTDTLALVANITTHAAVITGVHGLIITVGKTLTLTNALTLSGTDASTLDIGTGGTLGTAAYVTAADYATLVGAEELTNKTLNASVAKGTWTASGAWTIPAVTLNGTVTLNGQAFDAGDGSLQIATTTAFSGLEITDIVNSNAGVALTTTHSRGVAGHDDDNLFAIISKGFNDAATPELIVYTNLYTVIEDASDGSEAAKLIYYLKYNGADNLVMTLSGAGALWIDDALEIGGALTGATTGTFSGLVTISGNNLSFDTTASYIGSPNVNGTYSKFVSRDTDNALVEIARMQGAADPWFGLGVDGAVLKATNGGLLGLFGATPVAQQTGCEVPTDLTESIAAITALRTAVNNLGLTTVV